MAYNNRCAHHIFQLRQTRMGVVGGFHLYFEHGCIVHNGLDERRRPLPVNKVRTLQLNAMQTDLLRRTVSILTEIWKLSFLAEK
jgi:hypothetical protein